MVDATKQLEQAMQSAGEIERLRAESRAKSELLREAKRLLLVQQSREAALGEQIAQLTLERDQARNDLTLVNEANIAFERAIGEHQGVAARASRAAAAALFLAEQNAKMLNLLLAISRNHIAMFFLPKQLNRWVWDTLAEAKNPKQVREIPEPPMQGSGQ